MRRFLTRSVVALAAVIAVLGVTEGSADAAIYMKIEGVDGDSKATALLEVGILEPRAPVVFLRLNGREIPVSAR